jgi:hypothetical protein
MGKIVSNAVNLKLKTRLPLVDLEEVEHAYLMYRGLRVISTLAGLQCGIQSIFYLDGRANIESVWDGELVPDEAHGPLYAHVRMSQFHISTIRDPGY